MLRRYKIGKKIKFKWQLLINNRAPRYDDELSLTMCDPHFNITEIDFIIENGFIVADVPQLYHLGEYTFTLSNKDICVDCKPFEIVRESLEETECVCSDAVTCGIVGDSAFDVWRKYQQQFDMRDYTENEFFEAIRGWSAFDVWRQEMNRPRAKFSEYCAYIAGMSGYEAWQQLPENEDKTISDFVNEMKCAHRPRPMTHRRAADILRENGIDPETGNKM